MRTNIARHGGALGAAALALMVAGCATPTSADDAGGEGTASSDVQESETPQLRLAVAHEDGVAVLDGATLEALGDFPIEDDIRVAPAGDGRHVMVTTSSGFDVLDTGTWTDAHGDHGHSYTADPAMTDIEFTMTDPGHLVPHLGTTALFSDGDGTVTLFDSADLADGQPDADTVDLLAPHHGVALMLADGTMVTTEGTEETRSSVVARDAAGAEVARTDVCPDVHGEAIAADEVLGFGCTGSVAVFRDGAFASIPAPDAAASIGSLAGSEESDILLADYVTEDPDLDGANRIALVDTAAGTMSVVTLPTTYSYYGFGRGPEGDMLVLGTDGALHRLDPDTGDVTASIPMIEGWTPPEDWREPRPTLTVEGDIAYVTDPAGARVVAVDLEEDEIVAKAELDSVPTGTAPVSG